MFGSYNDEINFIYHRAFHNYLNEYSENNLSHIVQNFLVCLHVYNMRLACQQLQVKLKCAFLIN